MLNVWQAWNTMNDKTLLQIEYNDKQYLRSKF